MTMMMMDKGMLGTTGSSMPGMNMPGAMAGMPASMAMVPRCTMKMEKCAGGMKIHCKCEDEMSRVMMQNLCKMMAGGMCSFYCMMNGMVMCHCNMAMCKCECTSTKDGVCFTCTSGDKACCDMCQACCDCMMHCMEAGCMCCVCLGGMPCCCGTC
jgi:hypothetical protein